MIDRLRRWLQVERLRRADLAPLALLVLPTRQLWVGWGWDRATGVPGEALYSTLFAGAQVRRWFTGAAEPLTADLALGSGSWLPEHLLAALWQAGLGALTDEGFAYGALLFLGVFLAGYGPWRWLQDRLGDRSPLGPALFAALLIQLSPAVIRAGLVGDIGILALGPVALALRGSPAWALVAGLCSPVAAVVAGAGGLLARRWWAGLALLPLVAWLSVSPSGVPGAARVLAQPEATVLAYVGDGGGLLPLPPAEVQALRGGESEHAGAPGPQGAGPPGAEGAAPPGSEGATATGPMTPGSGHPAPAQGGPPHVEGGASMGAPTPELDPLSLASAEGTADLPAPTDLPARWPGGLTPTLALLAALILGRDRRHALAALALGLLSAAVVGWTPAVGQPLTSLGPLAELVPTGVPGLGGVAGTSAWLLAPLLLIARSAARMRLPVVLMGLVAFQAVSEAPLHQPQLTSLAPEPATMALLGIPPGKAVVFPSPARPWRQGQRSTAELLFRATRHQHPLELGLSEVPGDLPLMLALSREADLPVDLSVAELAWSMREVEPWAAAEAAGFTGLLIDRGALEESAAQSLDGAVAREVGTSFVSQGDWSVHGLVRLGASPSEGAP